MKKKKKSIWDIFDSFFEDDLFSLSDMPEGATGYSIEVVYDGDKPIIKAKTYGNVDKTALIEQLRKMYPGAKIIVDGEEELAPREIRPITEEEERKEEKKFVTYRFNDRGELIKEGGKKKSILDLLKRKKQIFIED